MRIRDPSLGQRDQFLPLLGVQGQRLLHEDVFARPKALPDDVVVRGGGGGHGHGRQRRIVEHVGQLVGELGRIAWMLSVPNRAGVGVADALQRSELREHPHQVLAPVAAADHGDILVHLQTSRWRSGRAGRLRPRG